MRRLVPKMKKNYTPEQREAMRERCKRMNEMREQKRAERLAGVNNDKKEVMEVEEQEDLSNVKGIKDISFPTDEELQKNKKKKVGEVLLADATNKMLDPKDPNEAITYKNAIKELSQQVYNMRGSLTYAEKAVISIVALSQVQLYRRRKNDVLNDALTENKEIKAIYEGLNKLGLLNENKSGAKFIIEANKGLISNIDYGEKVQCDEDYIRWKEEMDQIDI